MKTIDDVIEYLNKQKELDKLAITNQNFNPDKLPDFKELAIKRRYENSKRRMLVDARINPHERSVPEGFCVTCKSFTTAYNSRGECSECGTEITVDISEGK